MGRKSHKAAPYMCGVCKTGFGSEKAARDHIKDAHPKTGGVGLFRCIDRINGPQFDDSPSMADLAVQAEIDRAMGIPNDDDWLLGD